MLATIVSLATLLPQDAPQSKLVPELRETVETAVSSTRFRVYAVLGERLDASELTREQALPRQQRKRAVADRLRGFAAPRQAKLLELLSGHERRGEVGRVRPLWITNTVVFHGTAQAILDVARLPEVERIGWDPIRDESAYTDVLPVPAGTPFYSQDFESGALPGEMVVGSTNCGFVSVTDQYGPGNGTYHMVMGSTQDDCESTATVTLTVDLSTATSADVRFMFKDMNDEFDAGEDILEASDDGGATWKFVAHLTGTDDTYVTQQFDLDPVGVNYVSNFMLRWSWSDNYAPETDGFGIDDIEIADLLPPPPPGPEPNLVQLQAPDLWTLGADGTGVVILNIDSGVDYTHPDLASRIFVNPLDPIDGVDNDNNGYVDDHMGWDFASDDNDPFPNGSNHGTSTAGIMVGDGTQGVLLTGMAPGAKMAVARIGGESTHWLASQWGLSVGVDCQSSSHSYKWPFSPKPDYHMHRMVEDVLLAAGISHANSIGNQGGAPDHPVPFNISAPGLVPAPWTHPVQGQPGAGTSGVMACGGILLDDSPYAPSGTGPSAWEDIRVYDGGYPHAQQPFFWDYPYGGFGGGMQGLVKPDVVTYTNVQTTKNGGLYGSFGGTSAATPHLGGALALLHSANPHAQPRHVAQVLQVSAEDLGPPGKDNQYGAGKVQVKDAALLLFHLVQVSDRTPSIGSSFTVDISGLPGDSFTTWVTRYPAPGSIGAVTIKPQVFATGTFDSTGHTQVTWNVKNDPSLVGAKMVFRSVADNTGGVTGQMLTSLVETVVVSP